MKKYACLFFMLVAAKLSFSQWTIQNANTTNDLNDIHFLNDSVGFIVGDDGVFLKTDDYGQNWVKSVIDPAEDLNAVFALNEDTVFVGGDNLHRTNNGGQNWITVFNIDIHEIKFLSDTVGYLRKGYQDDCGYPPSYIDVSRYLKTTDGGNTWQDSPQTEIGVTSGEMNVIDEDTAYIICNLHWWELIGCVSHYFGAIQRTTNGGKTWQEIQFDVFNYSDASFLNGWEGYTFRGKNLYKINEGGSELIYINQTPDDWPEHLFFATIYEGYYTTDGKIMRTISGGMIWEEDFNNPLNISDIKITKNYEGYAIGNSGLVLHKKIVPSYEPLHWLNTDTSQLNFPKTNITEESYLSFKLVASGTADIIADITAPSNFLIKPENAEEYVSQITGLLIPAQHDITISVAFLPGSPQFYQDSIVVASNASNNPEIKIPVYGKGIYRLPEIISNDTAYCADTVWLMNSLLVEEGSSLTFCPGTTVVVPYLTTSDVDIVIDGSLYAIGTAEDSIQFVVSWDAKQWDGMEINGDNTQDSVIMHYCVIENTNKDLWPLASYGGGIAVNGNRYVSIQHSTFSHCTANYGGGIYLSGSADLHLDSCDFQDCSAAQGAGVHINNSYNIKLQNCRIYDCFATNHGAGIFVQSSDEIWISGCEIYHDTVSTGNGAGILINGSSATILNNMIRDNLLLGSGAGGGVWSAASELVLINNIIKNNSSGMAGGGIFLYGTNDGTKSIMVQNLIVGNSSRNSKGGGICLQSAKVDLLLNTLADNHITGAWNDAGGIWCKQPDTTRIFGNILYGNSQSQLISEDKSKTIVSFCDIQGGWIGNGENNISSDPKFYGNPLSPWFSNEFDYSILPESPCVDAGIRDTLGWAIPPYDLAGNPRLAGEYLDIGAYENSFLYQPIDSGFCEGVDFQLEIIPIEEEIDYCTWSFNGEIIQAGPSNILLIENPTTEDEGFYQCTLFGPESTLTSRAIYLYNKGYAPLAIEQPAGAILDSGENYSIRFIVHSTDHILLYQWYLNDTIIQDANDWYFYIHDFNKANEGRYRCIAENTCGELMSDEAILQLNPSYIEEYDAGKLVISPNPASNQLAVSSQRSAVGGEWSVVRIEIIDVYGNRVAEYQNISALPFIVDVSGLVPGMYFLIVENEDEIRYSSKFIKVSH